ncbi:unnamed protein product [Heterotrigona itama]|uniref:Uncharacterized protein n=1 Tax=Heterotrigona itama TaxID=395501 RepID=A0A6V7GY19_9HYME|nr:unnamed protein product [Heterotrigona itama]
METIVHGFLPVFRMKNKQNTMLKIATDDDHSYKFEEFYTFVSMLAIEEKSESYVKTINIGFRIITYNDLEHHDQIILCCHNHISE